MKAAPEALTPISADIVVIYVVQRNVTHCRAQTHRPVIAQNMATTRNSKHHGAWRGNLGVCTVGFVMFLIMHHTNLTLKLRSGINWIAEQNNVKVNYTE